MRYVRASILLMGVAAVGKERMEACAKYKPTGRKYKVHATS